MKVQIAMMSILAAATLVQTHAAGAPAPVPDVVTVVAPKNVKVTGSYPADGADIPGGMVIIRVSFDQPMSADAWSYSKSDHGEFPNCLSEPRLLPDKRSFVLLCSLSPKTAYAFDINATPAFETVAGRKPPLYRVSFKTTGDINIGMHAALDAAGLNDSDNPIMNESFTPGGVKSPPRPAGDASAGRR